MRATLLGILVLLLAPFTAAAQKLDRQHSIEVKLIVDNQQVPCPDLRVELLIGNRHLALRIVNQSFAVPPIIEKLYASKSMHSKNNISTAIHCGSRTVVIDGLYPARALPGSWEVGIALPPNWFETFRWNDVIEHATWISYLSTDCLGCDPSLITSVAHSDYPQDAIQRLLEMQSSSRGEDTVKAAYGLAVFKTDYQKNRNFLLQTFEACLIKVESNKSEDDVCNRGLFDYITNLALRGDKELVIQLIRLNGKQNDLLSELGTFYQHLLEGHSSVAIQALAQFPVSQQQVVCKIAGSELYYTNEPVEETEKQLRSIQDEAALRCLQSFDQGLHR